jgi:hypothetical protein
MKREINNVARTASVKVDEIFLFREMAKAFNSTISKCTYVDEVHGKKGFVQYNSKYRSTPKTVEIADLLLLTYDQSKRDSDGIGSIKISFLQAKYEKRPYYKFLEFKGNVFQWELLKNKPTLLTAPKGMPLNILNFRDDYLSLTTYGIFYHEAKTGEVEFLYTLPSLIKPRNTLIGSSSSGIKYFDFYCRKGLKDPDINCKLGLSSNEAITTCSMNTFESQVLSWKVGAPVNMVIAPFIRQLLNKMSENKADSSIFEEVLTVFNNLDIVGYADFTLDELPPMMLVMTNSKDYTSRDKKE